MSAIAPIARTGLAAASLWADISANNIANTSTNGPPPVAAGSGASNFPPAFVPKRVDQVDLTDGSGAGGTAATATNAYPATVPAFDATAAYANKAGEVAAPNVNVSNQVVQQVIASYAFVTNAEVTRAGAKLMKSLLDIKA